MPSTKLIRAGVSTVGKFPSSHPEVIQPWGRGRWKWLRTRQTLAQLCSLTCGLGQVTSPLSLEPSQL